MKKKTIGIIGAGAMGGAIVRGLMSRGLPGAEVEIHVADTSREALKALKTAAEEREGAALLHTDTENARAVSADILLLAVKPHVMGTLISDIKTRVAPQTIAVSIAAGITLDTLSRWFAREGAGTHQKIVRVMPNTPATIGLGVTSICPAAQVSSEEAGAVEGIFSVLGKTVFMPERLMDACTALAGSSPAWTFMYIDALADAAVREGLPRKEALAIAAQSVMGAAALALESEKHPAALKDQVCSPGGTTIEGVAALEQAGFRSAVIQAVERCTARSRELGKSLEE